MFYTIYKITNKINGKIYIGKHQTKDLNDGYMGSGKHLKRSIEKYGIENFEKEILFQFDNEYDMNSKEAELVNEEFVLREDTYNICIGGQGGFGYINSVKEIRDIAAKKAIESQKEYLIANYGVDHISKTKNARKIISDRNRELHKNGRLNPPTFYGKTHTEESKIKISKSNSNNQNGDKNSQFGTMWITDGIENKKIKKDVDIIPEGWYKGRSNKK